MDSFKEITEQTDWILKFDEDFVLQLQGHALIALFAINVDKQSNWKNIPKSILKDGCIDFFVRDEWHNYQFIDQEIDLDKALLARWIVTILRKAEPTVN